MLVEAFIISGSIFMAACFASDTDVKRTEDIAALFGFALAMWAAAVITAIVQAVT